MARPSTPAPSHLIPLALLLLAFHGVLAADYVVQRFALGAEATPALMRFVPLDALWLKVVWAMAVWLGLVAAIFLMLRDNASVLLFFAAGVCALAAAVGLFAASAPGLMVPLPALLAAMVVIPLFGWLYARALNRADVLH